MVASHEMGHAVVAAALDVPFKHVRVNLDSMTGGVVAHDAWGDLVGDALKRTKSKRARAQLRHHLFVLLAGQASAQAFLKRRYRMELRDESGVERIPGAEKDLAVAFKIASAMAGDSDAATTMLGELIVRLDAVFDLDEVAAGVDVLVQVLVARRHMTSKQVGAVLWNNGDSLEIIVALGLLGSLNS
jgi:hypothetical protein